MVLTWPTHTISCVSGIRPRTGRAAVLCPYCAHDDSKVMDSRDAGAGIRRRRECLRCSLRFTTYEGVQTGALLVVKRDGRREEFSREKLRTSLTKACAKRPLPIGSIDKGVDDIQTHLYEAGRAEIQSKLIGELIMDRLIRMDRVAYIRYASVYRDFRDIESFKAEIDALLEPGEPQTEPGNQLSFLDEVEDDLPRTNRRKRRGRRLKRPNVEPA